jgi:hypothetical protein
VECWNGVRGIDHLLSRPDVDPERIGVTGISGGGAATYWVAAADERVKVAVPVSGMADLVSYVSNRVVNGHCDCLFLYNTYQWPWNRIAALIAPRPMLFVNSDHDTIFPMDANERVINRLERVYSLFGKSDLVDSVVSIGGHAYRQDIRQAAFRFLNTHLKGDPRPVLDSEVDLVTGPREEVHPISPEQLRVFPLDSDIPRDARNGRIDQEFVPMPRVDPPSEEQFAAWSSDLLRKLRRLTFHHFPDRVPAGERLDGSSDHLTHLETEPGIHVRVNSLKPAGAGTQRILLWLTGSNAMSAPPAWLGALLQTNDALYACEPRGLGLSQWTRQDPPNYVERAHYLLGRTVDSGRIWDIIATARFLRAQHEGGLPVVLAGEDGAGALAIYAALLEREIAGLILQNPPASLMDRSAPALLNALRVCDVPEALGLVAPRPVTIAGFGGDWPQATASLYRAARAAEKLVIRAQ